MKLALLERSDATAAGGWSPLLRCAPLPILLSALQVALYVSGTGQDLLSRPHPKFLPFNLACCISVSLSYNFSGYLGHMLSRLSLPHCIIVSHTHTHVYVCVYIYIYIPPQDTSRFLCHGHCPSWLRSCSIFFPMFLNPINPLKTEFILNNI
jgi:hypothetical protein